MIFLDTKNYHATALHALHLNDRENILQDFFQQSFFSSWQVLIIPSHKICLLVDATKLGGGKDLAIMSSLT
jgi:hypothetical protein